MISTDHKVHWESLARRDPYFAVLTDARYQLASLDEAALREFFDSGKDYVGRILTATAMSDRSLGVVADFGCGVRRVTLAFAEHAERVTGVDVSVTMLQHANTHALQAGVTNVAWCTVESFLADDSIFDLVHSFLVFQHIPPTQGVPLLTKLAARVRIGGMLVIHVPFWRDGGVLKRFLRWLRAEIPGLNVVANILTGHEPTSPYMQMNVYDLNVVLSALSSLGFDSLQLMIEREKGIKGAIILGQRRGVR